jgi:hypothetical protein
MTTCPNCGCKFVASDSAASLVLGAIGTGDSSVSWITSQMPEGLSKKEIYNALAYLTRKKLVSRISYGLYRRVRPTPSRQQEK